MPAVARLWTVGLVALLLAAAPARAGAEAKEILRRAGLQKGICVVLGLPKADEPALVVDLAAGAELTVYFQTPSAAEELAVRRAAEKAGLLGKRVFADRGPWERIHLADNLAGAVWVAPAAQGKVPQAELLRVLHPEGKALVGEEEIPKPFPAGIDAWSQPFHGPDNNPQSRDQVARAPYLTQFLAEPVFSPMPEVTVAAGGRVFKAFGHIAHRANQNAVLNTLMGINGYNGAILWRRPLREGFCIHRNTMIATPDTLYLGDDESCKLLDARTGELKDQIVVRDGLGDGKVWKWMSLESRGDGRAVLYALVGGAEVQPKTVPSQSAGLGHWPWSMWEGHDYKNPKTSFAFGRTFVAIDPQSKKVLWDHSEQGYVDGRGVAMKDARIYYYCPGRFLACLDANSGKVLWRNSDANLLAAIAPTGRAQNPGQGYSTTSYLKCDDKYVYFAGSQRPNLVVASASDGKLVWQRRDGNLHLVLRADGFYAIGPGGGKLTYDTWQVVAPMPNRRSCTRATGSVDSVFYRAAEGTMWINTADNTAQHIAPMRPPCQDGVVIANGMLYWGPWMCGCPLSFYGHVGLAPAGGFNFRPGADASRLEPGEGDPKAVRKLPVEPGDWPSWMGDNQRRCVTPIAMPDKVKPQWTAALPDAGRATAPVTAGGLAFVGYENGALRALDAAAGQVRWQAFTAGPIYVAPAIWEGRVYAGSADGRVYAFEAATGRRLWAFRAAPAERWIPVLGKLISTWPVAGGVVVRDGVVYAAAGIANYDGTHVYALDATTGKLLWCNDSSGTLSPSVKSGISLQGELYLDGNELRFPAGTVYATARYDLKTGKCLNDPQHQIGSRTATAYYAYYPEYGQFTPLEHDLPDGRTLSYQVLYEGSRQAALAMLRPLKQGAAAPPPNWRLRLKGDATPPRQTAWHLPQGRKFNAFIVAPNLLLAAGQEGSQAFLAAIRLQDGSLLWEEKLPAPAVKGGLASDHQGRILLSLSDGRTVCFAPTK
ncbi:MAG TPA: PQQ-binding-like beta-propeller repeat protein [Planctomycetota bacterium]|nr:PQQ-binding-like beta-propeller repeat protein [Planctomycetota bacterium]